MLEMDLLLNGAFLPLNKIWGTMGTLASLAMAILVVLIKKTTEGSMLSSTLQFK